MTTAKLEDQPQRTAPSTVARGRRWIFAAICFVAALAALISRKPEQWFAPQFWAEDGTQFFFDAETHGWLSCLKPYAGYLLVGSRAIASMASWWPWEYQPAIYVFAAGALAAAVAVRIAFSRLPMVVRVLGPVAVVAVPHSGEVFLNVTNLNWILALLLPLNLLEPSPTGRGETWRRSGEVLLAGLSGLNAIFLAPFALGWAWQQRWRREACVVLAAWLLAVLIQITVLAGESESRAITGLGEIIGSLDWVVSRYAMTVFVGRWAPFHSGWGWAIALVVIGMIAALLWDRTNRFRLQAIALWCAGAGLLVAGRFGSETWGHPFAGGARYTYVPLVLFLWGFAWLVAGTERRGSRILAMTLYLCPVVAAWSMWRSPPQPQFDWPGQVAEVRAGVRDRLEVPPGHSFRVPRRETGR